MARGSRSFYAHIQRQVLQSHSSFKQIPIDLCVGSQDLTARCASMRELHETKFAAPLRIS